MLPIVSIVISHPASSHHSTNKSRPCLSSFDNASRQLPPFFVAPISRPDQIGDLFVKACPLIIAATGLVFCFRANVFVYIQLNICSHRGTRDLRLKIKPLQSLH